MEEKNVFFFKSEDDKVLSGTQNGSTMYRACLQLDSIEDFIISRSKM